MEIKGENLISNLSEPQLETLEAGGKSGSPPGEIQNTRPLEADRMVAFPKAGLAGLLPETPFQFEPVPAGQVGAPFIPGGSLTAVVAGFQPPPADLSAPGDPVTAVWVPVAVAGAMAAGAGGLSLDDVKGQLREDVKMLADLLSDWPPGADETSFTLHELERQPDGTYKFVARDVQITREQAENLMTGMEELIQTTDDMSQLENLDLTDLMDKSQSTTQTISNIMQTIHDVLKSMLMNLKA